MEIGVHLPGDAAWLETLTGGRRRRSEVVARTVEVSSDVDTWKAVGGTSGGGLVALALAHGLAPDHICDLTSKMLQRDDLLDTGKPWEFGPGVYRGNVIAKILRETFGETRMGDLKLHARVGVASLWTREVCLVDSVRHPEVFVWRAARATMGIEGLFDPVRLREDNARTYSDGGVGLNVPAGMWDDNSLPTVVLRFTRQQRYHDPASLMIAADGGADADDAEAVRDYSDVVTASFDLLMDASAAAFPSYKHEDNLYEVPLDSDANGMRFGLAPAECSVRHIQAVWSARRWLIGAEARSPSSLGSTGGSSESPSMGSAAPKKSSAYANGGARL